MYKRIGALAVVIGLAFAALPASAQTDPAADATLQAILLNQVHQTGDDDSGLLQQIQQTQQAVQQVQQMVKDHQSFSDIFRDRIDGISQLTQTLQTNNDLMTRTVADDQKVNSEMKRLVPSYRQGQDYVQYVNTLYKNSMQTYAQSLGVADSAVSGEAAINKAIQQLAQPSNQLQGIQELVTIGKMQIQQLDKLIKIQAAMMKSMAVTYERQMMIGQGGSAGYNTSAGMIADSATQAAALRYCSSHVPFFNSLSLPTQQKALQQCHIKAQQDAQQIQQATQQP